jgi:hypothetical protein
MAKPEAKIDTGEEMGLGPFSGPWGREASADHGVLGAGDEQVV